MYLSYKYNDIVVNYINVVCNCYKDNKKMINLKVCVSKLPNTQQKST